MVTLLREWNDFISNEEKIEKLKQWSLISPKSNIIKTLTYKGHYADKPTICDVIGYVDDNEIIIKIDEEISSIHPTYLKEMQKPNFSKFELAESEDQEEI
ncbi:hypothetical protein FRZ06_11485 [Anoxybacterium hadale]|uniref:Uncharacterized protein n=1 Tax=Anoxybacterium hadale TaxID=3408580 RepID=A0ACD1ABD6_9FIRM|nr:hypothetical protein FRZ06_11485 [Clostridiales bacterium]